MNKKTTAKTAETAPVTDKTRIRKVTAFMDTTRATPTYWLEFLGMLTEISATSCTKRTMAGLVSYASVLMGWPAVVAGGQTASATKKATTVLRVGSMFGGTWAVFSLGENNDAFVVSKIDNSGDNVPNAIVGRVGKTADVVLLGILSAVLGVDSDLLRTFGNFTQAMRAASVRKTVLSTMHPFLRKKINAGLCIDAMHYGIQEQHNAAKDDLRAQYDRIQHECVSELRAALAVDMKKGK